MSDTIAAVQRLYEAFAQEDDEALLETLGPEVEWYVPDALPYGGTFHGVEQVRDYLGALSSFVERGRLDTVRMIEADNHVVVLGHWTSRTAGGDRFDARFADVFEVRDGMIVRLDSYLDTARVLNGFQGEGLPPGTTSTDGGSEATGARTGARPQKQTTAAPLLETDHRPEVAIPLTQSLWIEATGGPAEGGKRVSGHAIAVGWDRPQSTTFYLVSDGNFARPVWISEDDVTTHSVGPPS